MHAMPGIWVKHNLQGHITGFQDLIVDLNESRLGEFLISMGSKFQIFGPRLFNVSEPHNIEFTAGVTKSFLFLRL